MTAEERKETKTWERFCREQARESATKFFDKVRRFKERNPSTSDIHDSVFANEFSAAFLEESVTVFRSSGVMNGVGNGVSHTMTMSRQGQRKGGSPHTKSGGRAWWNIFKWAKFSRAESASRKSPVAGAADTHGVVLLEGIVDLLNMNESMQTLVWQQCRLVLLQQQGHHQLEVFYPPKNPIPKMSLFCFLIQDVRSTHLLEIPDSTTSFVVKSQNHGEYVFDTGSEESKQEWIRAIQQFCNRPSQNHTPNGHIAMTSSAGPTSNGYIHSVLTDGAALSRVGDSAATNSIPQPRASHNGAGIMGAQEVVIESLTSSPVTYGQKKYGSQDGTRERSRLLNTEHPSESEESVLCDISLFVRNQPPGSPNRYRKAQSMFVDTPSSTLPSTSHPLSSLQSSPPPIPKRNTVSSNPRSGLSYSNQSTTFSSAVPTCTSSAHNSPYRGEPQRKLSQPNIEGQLSLPSSSLHELPSSGNLETCSQSSSSSALHPVSLAAVQRTCRRKGSVPSSPTASAQESPPSAHKAQNYGRKTSAPVLVSASLQLEDPTKGRRRLNGRFDPYQSEEELNIREESNFEEIHIMRSRRHDDSDSAGSTGSDTNPRNTSPLTTNKFHYGASSHGSHRRLETKVGSTGVQSEASNSRIPLPLDTQTRVDNVSPSNQSPRSTSSSSEGPGTPPQDTHDGSNPIYVETTEGQGYDQGVTFTHHPYESWATTHQDMQNLRALAHFPWFHGMISRANASQLVLTGGEEGSGQYLVRQSESREGDFVLTFNYHNRAKHLRMAVDESGCNIQHLWFSDVTGMLEYFKTNSIPLESFWLNDDVKLTSYIERSASDAFRTTTVVNVDRLHRSPPRRTRSLHLSHTIGTHRTVMGSNPNTPSPSEQHQIVQDSGGDGENPQSNSLPHTARNSTGWRQFFRSQRSSSAGNIGRVQRRHSANAGSLLDTRRMVPQDRSENNYVFRY